MGPIRRKTYRTWMKMARPVPPRVSGERIEQLQFNLLAAANGVNHQREGEQHFGLNQHGDFNQEENGETVCELNDAQDHGSYRSDNSSLSQSEAQNTDSDSENTSISSRTEESSEASSHSTSAADSNSNEENAGEQNEANETEWEPTRYPDLDELLFPNASSTKFECLLMILTFSLRHGLTQVATEDLCKLVNNILGGDYIPSSTYMLKKIFGSSEYTIHFYCAKENCGAYVGNISSTAKRVGSLKCPVGLCKKQFLVSSMNNGFFFITFPIEEQLKFMLVNTDNVLEHLDYRWSRECETGVISDVYDGKLYQEFSQPGGFLSEKYNLSLTINTDGAVVFDSSKNTLWPIYFRINEFPPHIRYNQDKHLVCGLWFASKEPSMHLFLSTFVREINNLKENGFTWRAPNGNNIHSKVMMLNGVFDSKCKPVVQNIKAFNGYNGCGYCLHPGVVFGSNHSAKYPMNDDVALLNDYGFCFTVTKYEKDLGEDRTHQVDDRDNNSIRQDMDSAERLLNVQGEGPSVRGVKGRSVLCPLPYFDMVFGFALDYLHAVLLGTTKSVTGLWFDTSSSDELYYLDEDKRKEVDKRLLGIKPPTSISRRPRTLDERKNWHGNEWRTWLLYYSLPCLKGILPTRYFKHHCLLVSAIYYLLQDKITSENLQTATWYLGQYCTEFATLYWPCNMKYNVHLLLHLGKCVYFNGPLYAFSCFSFEGANGVLVRLVKGTRGVLSQIADKYLRCTHIPKLLQLFNVSESAIDYCDELMCYRTVKNSNTFDTVTVLGTERCFPLDEEEEDAFIESGSDKISWSYERMVVNKILYHAECYVRRGTKSNNSIVELRDGSYGVLKRIIGPQHLQCDSVKLLVRKINVQRNEFITKHPCGAKASHIKVCSVRTFGNLNLICISELSRKAILIECGEENYVSDFANTWEKD